MNACRQHKKCDGNEREGGNGAHPVVAPCRPECRKDGANKECSAAENGGWSARNEWRKVAPPTTVKEEPRPVGADECPRVPCVDAEIWVVPRRLTNLADHVHHGEPKREGDKGDDRCANESGQHHTPRVTCAASANQSESGEEWNQDAELWFHHSGECRECGCAKCLAANQF